MTDATLSELSNSLVGSAIVVYALAMLVYAGHLAGSSRDAEDTCDTGDTDRTRSLVATVSSGAMPSRPAGRREAPGDLADLGRGAPSPMGQRRLEGIATALTVLAVLLHAAGVATRGLAADRVPWGNMYEFATTGALAAAAGFLVTHRLIRLRGLGVVVVGSVLLTLGLAVTVLYTPAGPLVPALNSYWLVIHVVAAIVSAGAFTVGAAATVLYLMRRRSDRRGTPSRLPAAEALDRVAQVTHTFAFPVWTFAVIAGAIWAENAWGRYWGWDPKETWAFITWAVYAAYLHARATAGWRDGAAARLALLGYLALVFNFFGVNMWITGLHSYAGI